MKDLIIVGAGEGEIIKLVNKINSIKKEWNIIGFTDKKPELWGKELLGFPILGDVDVIKTFPNVFVIVNVSSKPSLRKKAYESARRYTTRFATLISPDVDTSYCTIGEGVVIHDGVKLGVNVIIGDHSIIWRGVTIGHDTKIGRFCVINPSAAISGRVTIGDETLVGTGANIIQDIHIGKNVTIAMGSSVFNNIESNVTYMMEVRRVIWKKDTKSK